MPNKRVQVVSNLLAAGIVRRAAPTVAVGPKVVGAKKTGAWRYPGGRIQRAPSIMINGKRYTDPKSLPAQEPRREQQSNFFLTINTNKAPSTDTEMQRGISHMEQMLNYLGQDVTLSRYLQLGPRDPRPYASDRFADIIKGIDWSAAIETGDVQHRLHSHVRLSVTHYSQMQINVHRLQSEAKRGFNHGLKLGDALRLTKSPYVHVHLDPQSNWQQVRTQYLHKGVISF